ncbi:MAG: efflux RND transporter periplasmic adaptor subunit [Eubacteriales bacterium]
MKSKKKKIMIVILISALVVAVGIGTGMSAIRKQGEGLSTIAEDDLTVVEAAEFMNTIKETGVVKSSDTYQVYATQNYTVKEIYVAVGDTVKEGDFLVELDTTDIEEQIAAKELEMSLSSATSNLQLEQAERTYEQQLQSIESGTNSAVVSARQVLDNAKRNMVDANADYADSNENEQLYEVALSAQYSYLQAVENYDLTVASALQQLESYEDSVESATLAGNQEVSQLTLASLYESLEETTILAPVSGTITAIYAVQGNMASGVLVVIEDLDNLVVEVSVGELDVLEISNGMDAVIALNIANADNYAGVVTSIAPTAAKDATGNTILSATPTYTVNLAVADQDTPFLVGMNVKVDVITEYMEEAIMVPIDNIYENENGNSSILVLEPVDDQLDVYIVREVEVELGSTDNYVQIIENDTIKVGTTIIPYTEEYVGYLNQEVTVATANHSDEKVQESSDQGGVVRYEVQ